MLQDNPGYYVQSGRRGGMEIYNAAGKRVREPGQPSGFVLPSNYDNAWLKNLSFGDPLRKLFGSEDIRRGNTAGQDWSGSSINNPEWANRIYSPRDQSGSASRADEALGDAYDRNNPPPVRRR